MADAYLAKSLYPDYRERSESQPQTNGPSENWPQNPIALLTEREREGRDTWRQGHWQGP